MPDLFNVWLMIMLTYLAFAFLTGHNFYYNQHGMYL
ncbi:hypothetical protein QFZ51_000341 [Chitinophaga sp. W3I9]